jgi:hypothetical protein
MGFFDIIRRLKERIVPVPVPTGDATAEQPRGKNRPCVVCGAEYAKHKKHGNYFCKSCKKEYNRELKRALNGI